MVFLITTRSGLDELRALVGRVPSPVWVAHGVLASEEIAELRAKGCVLTTFVAGTNPGALAGLEQTLETISMHHPGAGIWVECAPQQAETLA